MQNRPPPPDKSHLFNIKKGRGRQAPTSVTDASRAHPAAPMKPQPPPPPPPLPLASMNASGSGPPLAPSPQSHRPPSNNHHAGPPPPPAGQARPLPSSLATPDIRKQVTSAMKLLAAITRDQQDREYLDSAYEWPDLGEEERTALNDKLAAARQAEMAQRDKTIETTFSRLSNDMMALFTGLVEHATSSRLEGLARRCDAQQKRIDDLEAQRGASSTTTTGDTSAAAATVAAAQQKRIDDLERKLNTLVQAQAQAQAQQTTSSSSPRPAAAPSGRPHAFSPAAASAGASASPPGTPFNPTTTTSAPADSHATYKELRDKYRYVGIEVRSQKARIEKLDETVGALQKKLAGQSQLEEGTGGEQVVVKGLEKRLEKVEQALVVTQQPPNGAGNGGAGAATGGGGTVDPRRRPSSTTPSDAQAPAAAAAAAAEVAALRTDFDALAARVSSQLGKRPHDGVESGADHPHKAHKSTEGATPASASSSAATAAARDDEQQQQQLKERLQKVEERLEGCEEKVTALRSDVDKDGSRIDATVVNVAELEKKDKERTEREQAAAAAPPVSKGGSSTSDMDLDKGDDEDEKERAHAANAEKFDVLERRIQQMEASGSPELLIEPVKNEVAELRKLFDERVPSLDSPEHPKMILTLVRKLETAVAQSSEFATPVLEALRSFVGTAADGSALPADQVRSRLLDTLVRMRDDLQRHGTTLASHEQSIKSLVKSSEDADSKFEALEDLGNLLSEALPQLRDLYIVVCRAQEMNLFPKTATFFPNANANANANRLAIGNGSHGSPTPGASAAANAAPNGIVNGASGGGGANPAPRPNGIVGAPPPATTASASSTPATGATTGANAAAQGRPSATPAAAAPSTSTSTSANPSSLPQRPPQPQGQQQRPGSANGSGFPIGPGVGWVLGGPR